MSTFDVSKLGNLKKAEDINALKGYLFQLTEQLKYNFNNMTPEDNFSPEAYTKYLASGDASSAIEQAINKIVMYVKDGSGTTQMQLSAAMAELISAEIHLISDKIALLTPDGSAVASLTSGMATLIAEQISLYGAVTFNNLTTAGQTTINGSNIHGGTLTLGGNNNQNGVMVIKDASGTVIGTYDRNGIVLITGAKNVATGAPKATMTISPTENSAIKVQKVVTYRDSETGEITTEYPTVWFGVDELKMIEDATLLDTATEYSSKLTPDGLSFDTKKSSDYLVDYCDVRGDMDVSGDFSASGSKNRAVETDFGTILLSAYETGSPMFGDIGESVIGEDGYAYIYLDPRFLDVADTSSYSVFLQRYAEGTLELELRTPQYFKVRGTPGIHFAWEVKAKQAGYTTTRLDTKIPRKTREELKADRGVNYGSLAQAYLTSLYNEWEASA